MNGDNVKLSDLDGSCVAVVLEHQGASRVVRGTAHYEVDEDLGNCLRVLLEESPGNPHFLFPEPAEELEVEPDWQYGCDYTISVRASPFP